MKFAYSFLCAFLALTCAHAADTIQGDFVKGRNFLVDSSGRTFNAVVAYTTDGSNHAIPVGGTYGSGSGDSISGDFLKGNQFLTDSSGRVWDAQVCYTTDGSNNVIPISAGGGGITLGNLTETTSSVLNISGGTNAVVGSGVTIAVQTATNSVPGVISAADHTTFAAKQAALSVGAFGSSPNSGGGGVSGATLTLQPADATHPGGISNSSQTLSGIKTFSSAPNLSSLTASKALVLDSSKNMSTLGFTTSGQASSLLELDGNSNAAVNNAFQKYLFWTMGVSGSGGNLNMDATTAHNISFVGTTNQGVILTNVSTVPIGAEYSFKNYSTTNDVIIFIPGPSLLATLKPGQTLGVTSNTQTEGSTSEWDLVVGSINFIMGAIDQGVANSAGGNIVNGQISLNTAGRSGGNGIVTGSNQAWIGVKDFKTAIQSDNVLWSYGLAQFFPQEDVLALELNNFNGGTADILHALVVETNVDVFQIKHDGTITLGGLTASKFLATDSSSNMIAKDIGYADLPEPAVDNFSGDGTTVDFTLSISPASVNHTMVYVSGIYQNKSTYSISGSTLTFSVAPALGANNVEVNTL